MSASEELQTIYAEWHRLARAEGDAIRSGDWPRVAECQRALRLLQPRVVRCMEEARQKSARPGIDSEQDNLRRLITGLIEIENQNHALLVASRESLQTQRGQLERSGRNLRQIQRSYAPARSPAWSSFS